MREWRNRKYIALVTAVLLLGGCDTASQSGTRLSLALADAPVDRATEVVLQIRGVELELADGEKRLFAFEPPKSIDVLAASGGRSVPLLSGVEVPAGAYAAVRLLLNAGDARMDSYLRLSDGSQHELRVPADAQSALRVAQGFQVPAGTHAAYTLDLDLRRSLFDPEASDGAYLLRPVLRLVNNADAGAIRGTVGSHLIGSGCTPAVYVFADTAHPDDVDGRAPEPLASTRVAIRSGGYEYVVAFLPPGQYRVAFTCDAGIDSPAGDDLMTFIPSDGAPVTVAPARTSQLALGQGSTPSGCERHGKPDKPDKPSKPDRDDDDEDETPDDEDEPAEDEEDASNDDGSNGEPDAC